MDTLNNHSNKLKLVLTTLMSSFATSSHFHELLASLQHTGFTNTSREFQVASLNATGTFKNPLEYDDGTPLFHVINNNFIRLVHERFQHDETAIERLYALLNTIDKDINTLRYSPFYRANITINEMDEETFAKLWDYEWLTTIVNSSKFQKILLKEYNKMYQIENPTETQLREFSESIQSHVRVFDWLGYCAIRQAGVTNLQELHGRLVSLPDKTRMLHELVQSKNLDVLFLQEMFDIRTVPEGYQLLQLPLKEGYSERTGILLRNDFHAMELPSFTSPTALHETFYGCVVENVIFVSVHLSSKNRKKAGMIASTDAEGNSIIITNPKNYEDQKLELDWLFSEFYRLGYRVVCGMDANHAVEVNLTYLQAYPNKYYPVYTTSKMRLDMQAQYGKRRQWAKECRDSIVVTGSIVESVVQSLDGKIVNGENTPCCPSREHPFDHLLVMAHVVVS